MKKVLFFVQALCVIASGSVFAQEVTDVQKAAEEAAKAISDAPVVQTAPPKPKYWTNSVLTNVNFVQAGYTNWAKGGVNNIALSAYVDANANYAKNTLSWANRLQMDYGFLYSEDKPIVQKNKDRMLLESTLGLKATKTLNYSAKFTFLNQFTSGYLYGTPAGEDPTRSDWRDARTLKSSFFSPAIATLGLGIDWIPNNWLKVNFAPLTGGFTIVESERLRRNYGMPRHSKYESTTEYPDAMDEQNKYLTTGNYYRSSRFEFGAQLSASAMLKVNDNFDASTNLILFSNYLNNPLNVRTNWDNRFMWKLAKYFTLTLTTSLIYDDTVLIVDTDHPSGHRAVQFTEGLQFGFSYTFKSK